MASPKIVACCLPLTWDYVPSQFLFSWSSMLMHSQGRYHIIMLTSRAASVARMQERMVAQALEAGADYILHIDVDQTYPKNTPEVLMKHIDNGLDIAAGLVPRREAGGFNAYMLKGNPPKLDQIDIKPGSGLINVQATGFGGMMVKPDVYRRIGEPYFSGLPAEYGPDVCFYAKCKKKGIKAWCDTDLRLGHIVPRVKYQ